MPEPSTLAVFAVASLMLAVVPGPAVLYIVARSLEQGRSAGLVSALGIGVGGFVHFVAAAAGLSALLAASAVAFSTVKWLGAAYLIYLGIQMVLSRPTEQESAAPPERSLHRIFIQGIVVDVLNPKVALFVLAFLPQFLDPARGSLLTQSLVLGGVFVGVGMISDSAYALLAGNLGGRLRSHPRVLRAQRYVSGTLCIGLGVAAAMSGSGRE